MNTQRKESKIKGFLNKLKNSFPDFFNSDIDTTSGNESGKDIAVELGISEESMIKIENEFKKAIKNTETIGKDDIEENKYSSFKNELNIATHATTEKIPNIERVERER